MEEVHEVFAPNYGLDFITLILLLKQLLTNIYEAFKVCVDGSNRFVHENDLFDNIVFLPLFNHLEYFLAIQNIFLLPLNLKMFWKFQVFELDLHQLYLPLDIL